MPHRNRVQRVAVVGAGMAGLAAARRLVGAGFDVTLFDKGRAPGGRVATRRVASAAGELAFDHGAQFCTAREPAFVAQVAEWERAGLAAPWRARFRYQGPDGTLEEAHDAARWVGVPGMSALARSLAAGLDLRLEVRVKHAWRDEVCWSLDGEGGEALGAFDQLVLTLPPAQAVALLGDAPALRAQVAREALEPCWAVLLAFAEPFPAPFDAAFVAAGDDGRALAFAARNSSKPGRRGPETWVLHGAPRWSAARQELVPAGVIESLGAALAQLADTALPEPLYATAHLWRYARLSESIEPRAGAPFLADPSRNLWVGGDWCGAGRVEGAYLSGVALAETLLGRGRRRE